MQIVGPPAGPKPVRAPPHCAGLRNTLPQVFCPKFNGYGGHGGV